MNKLKNEQDLMFPALVSQGSTGIFAPYVSPCHPISLCRDITRKIPTRGYGGLYPH